MAKRGHSPLAANILAKKRLNTISDDLELLRRLPFAQCQKLSETEYCAQTQQQLIA